MKKNSQRGNSLIFTSTVHSRSNRPKKNTFFNENNLACQFVAIYVNFVIHTLYFSFSSKLWIHCGGAVNLPANNTSFNNLKKKARLNAELQLKNIEFIYLWNITTSCQYVYKKPNKFGRVELKPEWLLSPWKVCTSKK